MSCLPSQSILLVGLKLTHARVLEILKLTDAIHAALGVLLWDTKLTKANVERSISLQPVLHHTVCHNGTGHKKVHIN